MPNHQESTPRVSLEELLRKEGVLGEGQSLADLQSAIESLEEPEEVVTQVIELMAETSVQTVSVDLKREAHSFLDLKELLFREFIRIRNMEHLLRIVVDKGSTIEDNFATNTHIREQASLFYEQLRAAATMLKYLKEELKEINERAEEVLERDEAIFRLLAQISPSSIDPLARQSLNPLTEAALADLEAKNLPPPQEARVLYRTDYPMTFVLSMLFGSLLAGFFFWLSRL